MLIIIFKKKTKNPDPVSTENLRQFKNMFRILQMLFKIAFDVNFSNGEPMPKLRFRFPSASRNIVSFLFRNVLTFLPPTSQFDQYIVFLQGLNLVRQFDGSLSAKAQSLSLISSSFLLFFHFNIFHPIIRLLLALNIEILTFMI